jgi:hypothetical protein
MAENLSNIAKILVEDDKFFKTIEGNIKYIMKDGKVDAYDIPEIMTIVTECYNNLGRIKVSYEELPDILREIIDFIFEKYQIVPDEQEEKFKNMIDTVIKLIMLQPKIKKGCLKMKNLICGKCN